ncbi:toxin [Aphanothece hegewaldii CCALA 016]|uniref:Toxin n=1 Tax=Aphanothece hegewaldii CCALA 016 TaxID=2107694 RepID=A0A2T1LU07_9CHRO|nr:BrnT family toxin [Aphanothece hegewaldii]PSF34935.1 toxin [Aphanothece hegewaldii CCALA 016]
MKPFHWNPTKNQQLITQRGLSFDEVVQAIAQGQLLDLIEHPNPEQYSHQKIFIVKIKDYVYLVPFVENESEIFLKTIIPSRKMKKKYLGG